MKKFVHSCTLSRWKKLNEELRRAGHDPDDQKAIHDVRVAIRRFTQCLRTFSQFFDATKTKPIRRHLRKLMDKCGAARNFDIALEVLDAAGLHDKTLSAELEEQRGDAKKALVRKLPSWRKHHLKSHMHLQVSAEEPGPWNLKLSAAENAHRVMPIRAAEIFALGDTTAQAGYQKLHKFRLQVKRFRYTFELFQPLYADIERGEEMLRDLQDKLGAISDCGATLKVIKKNRPAVAAVRKLLTVRKAAFRKYWADDCGPEMRQWWKDTLGANSTEERDGIVHSKARRSGTARGRNSG